MIDFETLKVSSDGPVGRLVLDRPEKLNPLSTRTLEELVAAARWLDGEREVKVVIVSGAGRAFSSGADLSSFGGGSSDGRPAPRDGAEAGWLMAQAIEQMRAVTIAAIWGPCVGGGVVLATACDLRVAADDTYFSIPEVALGIPLAWGGIPRLVREIGPAMTRELVLTCRPFTAAEAKALGFLNRVVPAGEVMTVAEELASALSEQSALTLHATKANVNAALETMVPTGTSWSDADGLVTALHDAESRSVRDRYLERIEARRNG